MSQTETVEEPIKLGQKIVSQRIVKDEPNPQPIVVAPDDCPVTKRIEGRPEGALRAVSEKIKYYTQEGPKKVYVIVSFMPVTGTINGEDVVIERPVEFFVPSNQLSSEQQWVTASMRSLSLAARGGYITQALYDLRKVAWDKGPVRCGRNQYNKPIYHDSEVAAIAWSIQQILYREGFVKENGDPLPIEEQIAHRRQSTDVSEAIWAELKGLIEDLSSQSDHQMQEVLDEWLARVSPEQSGDPKGDNSATPKPGQLNEPTVGECPDCGEGLYLRDGCPTCVTGCGYSKCD